jgi:two-component system response regulator FixJ
MASAPPKRVLVVEDDDSMREAMSRLLDASGLANASYGSAEELLVRAAKEGAGCVVSDFRLPGMSGLDLLAEVRARGGWPPLILITAFDEPGLREEATRRGAAAYLVKPVPRDELLDAIRAAVKP